MHQPSTCLSPASCYLAAPLLALSLTVLTPHPAWPAGEMTAPYVTTVTKQPSAPAARSRLQRTLLIAALLLPLLLAIGLLAWMAVPKAGEGTGRASWMVRVFGRGGHGHGPARIGVDGESGRGRDRGMVSWRRDRIGEC